MSIKFGFADFVFVVGEFYEVEELDLRVEVLFKISVDLGWG